MAPSGNIVFYDIASGPPLRTFSPNPWKTRYALNLKGLQYRTEWIDMPDIHSVREELGIPANRTLPDGSPYHTLPVIHDLSTGKIVGDTFEIALYLDQTYPEAPRLIKSGTAGLTAALNSQVDGLFTKFVILADQMPFDPRVAGKIMEIFAKRMGGTTAFEKMQLNPEDREKLFIQFENALGEFVKAYHHVGGTTDYFWSATGTSTAQAQKDGRENIGSYLDGDEPAYADLIVGAWLAMLEASMRPDDWQRVRTWQGGFWGRLHDALAPLREIK